MLCYDLINSIGEYLEILDNPKIKTLCNICEVNVEYIDQYKKNENELNKIYNHKSQLNTSTFSFSSHQELYEMNEIVYFIHNLYDICQSCPRDVEISYLRRTLYNSISGFASTSNKKFRISMRMTLKYSNPVFLDNMDKIHIKIKTNLYNLMKNISLEILEDLNEYYKDLDVHYNARNLNVQYAARNDVH
jgi:hypothetical protein